MKYYTRAWATGGLPEQEFEEAHNAYQRRLDQIGGLLPDPLATIARDVSLHDALIRRVVADLSKNRLRLELLCGDLQIGYFDLDLEYRNVDWDCLDRKILARRARDNETEILCEEVDCLAERRFEHRLLFWPKDEISIRFNEFDLLRSARADRGFDRLEEPYVELGSLIRE